MLTLYKYLLQYFHTAFKPLDSGGISASHDPNLIDDLCGHVKYAYCSRNSNYTATSANMFGSYHLFVYIVKAVNNSNIATLLIMGNRAPVVNGPIDKTVSLIINNTFSNIQKENKNQENTKHTKDESESHIPRHIFLLPISLASAEHIYIYIYICTDLIF